MKFKQYAFQTDSNGRPWIWVYKGYEIRKTGTSEYPYNIYDKNHNHVGYERTLSHCKYFIDRETDNE